MDIYNCFLKYVQYDKIVRDYIVVYIKEHFFELKVKSYDKSIICERYEFLYNIDCVNGQIVFSDESNKVIFESPNALFDYLHSRFA